MITAQPSGAGQDALHSFKLLEALRSDDTAQVQPFLDGLPSSDGDEGSEAGAKLLCMAIKVSTPSIVEHILAHPSISPNTPFQTTPLHVASELGRADLVSLLLDEDSIDDTVHDSQGRTCLEVAKTSEVANCIENSRAFLQTQFLHRLANYIASPLSSAEESSKLVDFLSGPRMRIVNLNCLDSETGTSLMHEASRRRDLRLVELAVRQGADVFVRDKRGKRVLEGDKGGDERIKAFLRQFTNRDSVVQSQSDGRPPSLRGFLSKWTNYRNGYRTRWFVLENGVLSYYRNQEDEHVACRGSVAMGTASLHAAADGLRFEVHSKPSSSGAPAVPKLIVKSSHRAEIARWVQTIRLNIEYFSKPRTDAGGEEITKRSMSTTRDRADVHLPPPDTFLSPTLKRTTTGLSGISHRASTESRRRSSKRSSSPNGYDTYDSGSDGEGRKSRKSIVSIKEGVPHASSFELGAENVQTQIDLTEQLIDSIVVAPQVADPHQMVRSPSRQQAVKTALRESLSTLKSFTAKQHQMSLDRERWFHNRIEREVEARKLWEENMLTVAKQQADTDRLLGEAARDNEKKRKALRQARGVLAGISPNPSTPGGTTLDDMLRSPPESGKPTISLGAGILDVPPLRPETPPVKTAAQAAVDDAIDSDEESDEDDEFFDAIEAGSLPLKANPMIANPVRPGTPATSTEDKQLGVDQPGIVAALNRPSLEPYKHVRNKLPIDDDKRPSVSLWSILKSSIGKDLTKISFPVSFNECTSMLQRMAEDMEYDGCLTVAAEERDSLKRIAFVGAFAMSNYSSTIGRVAKPFNPLLGQSFEYAIPGRYRYVSEQVSHHPPMSACYSEAPKWRYYGEVDAQNKFMGRSFEIRPTGVAHCDIVLPRSWVREGLDYPAADEAYGKEMVVEHYSWKKVTTNISNFLYGSPIVDHYGDLIVTNHRTGETCTLTFKPRSWRGKDAFEIKGSVEDSAGRPVWEIAGRWDSQLVARQSGSSAAPLDPSSLPDSKAAEYLLLWKNSVKPKAPFNLTPFALTLNDIPEGLDQWLCPTDCRLRKDQRAFENAEYDKAQDLKTQQEEKQRRTRKLREEGKLAAHEPRWFSATTDADTGERMWSPKRVETGEVEFWAEREKRGKWKGVEDIFI